jgi:hypothetical protein
MDIACFGCSFTWGLELEEPATQSWPALLGANNQGQCAASNQTITRRLMQYLIDHTPNVVVIMWTYPARFEFVIDNNQFVSTHADSTISLENKAVPEYFDYFRQELFKTTASTDSAYIYTSLMAMHHAECMLNQHGIRHVFCTVADFDINSGCHPRVQQLYQHYAPTMMMFDGHSFESHARRLGSWGISHPLVAAHQSAATIIGRNLELIIK